MTNTETTTTGDIKAGEILRVTGPLVRATGMSEAKLYEVVKVSEEKFDLIFLDEMMPGLGGLETLSIIKEIDSKKYMEFMESTLEQITSSMDLDFDTMLGKPKQTGLDEFFWN